MIELEIAQQIKSIQEQLPKLEGSRLEKAESLCNLLNRCRIELHELDNDSTKWMGMYSDSQLEISKLNQELVDQGRKYALLEKEIEELKLNIE